MSVPNLAIGSINDIQELNSDEIQLIEGGLVHVAIFAAGLVVGFGLCALADYLNGGFND